MKQDKETVRALLVNTLTEFCEQHLEYNVHLQVEGLLGLTFDHNDVVLININKILQNVLARQQSQVMDLSTRKCDTLKTPENQAVKVAKNIKISPKEKNTVVAVTSSSPSVNMRGSNGSAMIDNVHVINTDEDYTSELGSTEMEELPFPVDSFLGNPDCDYDPANSVYNHISKDINFGQRNDWSPKRGRKRKHPRKVVYPQLCGMKKEHIGLDFQTSDINKQKDSNHTGIDLEVFEGRSSGGSSEGRGRSTVVKDEPVEVLEKNNLLIKPDDTAATNDVNRHEQVHPSDVPHVKVRIPPTARKSKPAKRCRVCYSRGKRKETRFYCPQCPSQPGLCPEECFAFYHSNDFYNNRPERLIGRGKVSCKLNSYHASSVMSGLSPGAYQLDTLPIAIASSIASSSPRSALGPESVTQGPTLVDMMDSWQGDDDCFLTAVQHPHENLEVKFVADTTNADQKDKELVQNGNGSIQQKDGDNEAAVQGTKDRAEMYSEEPKPLLRRRSSARLRRLSSAGGESNAIK